MSLGTRYLFENVEPLVKQDLWPLYMVHVYPTKHFIVNVKDDQLNLKWHADKSWSTKVNCVIIYPDSKKEEGKEFCERVVAKQRKEFTVAAAETVPPSVGTLDALPAKEKKKGYIFFVTDYEETIFQTTIPRPDQIIRKKETFVSQGEYEPISFAVRPLEYMGRGTIRVSDFKSRNDVIPKSCFKVKVVRHLTTRGFSSTSYRIEPRMLKDFNSVNLPKDITREFIVIVKVPDQAKPGKYTGTIQLESTKGINEKLLVSLTVYPFKLDRKTDVLFGFCGVIPDIKTAKMVRDQGFTSYGVGRKIDLKGFDKNGKPHLDFTKMDEYMKMLKKAGFIHAAHPDGGYRIPHIRGKGKDEEFFGKYEKLTGLSYIELLRRVFDAVKKHSDKQGWLPMAYMLVDETRNREVAKRQVAQIQAINQASKWVKTGGSFSVRYNKGRDPNDYHQWLFEALRAPALNNHDEGCIRMAKKLGKELYLYNQARGRYNFGAYMWSGYRKGIKGIMQWHIHTEHGWQFFDLDGREPDIGVFFFGEEGPIMTPMLLRYAEGADDFYYYLTLHNLVKQAKLKGGRVAQTAVQVRKILNEIETRIKVNEKQEPAWLDKNTLRQRCAEAIIKLDKIK